MLEPVTLEGQFVRLEPLSIDHHDGLCDAIADGRLWELFFTFVPPLDGVRDFIKTGNDDLDAGVSLPFATIDVASGKIVGSTRFMKSDAVNKRVEIGSTFIAKSFQKSRINTEAKLLMLAHAFDVLGVNRVEFLTDYLNSNSRRAILRLGAKEEGVLRNHLIMPDGRVRDSVLFSIIANEWDGVRKNLTHKLNSFS